MNGGSSTISMPGAPASTRNSVGRGSPSAIAFATTMYTAHTSPEVTNHFSPSMRQPASVRCAVVAIPDGSEPACSSVTA